MMNWEHLGPQNLYDILGVQPSADAAEIRSKYRQAALRIHPDKGGSAEAFHLLTFAFEVLSCPFARAAYDKNCKQSPPQHDHSPVRSPRFTTNTSVGASSNVKKAKRAVTARRQARYPMAEDSKRPAPPHTAEPPKKCRCTQQQSKTSTTDLRERMARIGAPLGQLRDVLRCMTADQRQAALKMLTPRVQTALVTFMETVQKCPTATFTRPQQPSAPSIPNLLAVSGITTAPNSAVKNVDAKYKAHMHVKALRFYTRGHAELGVALERQMVLVQLRQALSAAGSKSPDFWEDASQTYQLCLDVLHANNTSEEKLGLATYIYMRAGHWLLQNCTIISPVMPLAEAVELHCRFLRARRVSWQDLRAEWVLLMQCARYPAAKRRSLREAEAIADAARVSALKIQLSRAVVSTTKALEHEDQRALRRQRAEMLCRAREERAAARMKNAAVLAQRRSAKVKQPRWWRRSDLTMDDIMHGVRPRAEAGGS